MNFQEMQNLCDNPQEVDHLLLHIKAVINKELCQTDARSSIQYNQVVVNVAFRCYYNLLNKKNLEDRFFKDVIEHDFAKDSDLNEKDFIVIQSILLTNSKLDVNADIILQNLLRAFVVAIDSNHIALIAILKALNLLLKKYPQLNVDNVLTLDHIYFCLQSNQLGMRDECMSLLNSACSNRLLALEYFKCVLNYWPWTNRNKLFLMGCILNKHSLEEFLELCNHCKQEFFMGLKSCLCYKNLFAPSQYVVKALSAQKSLDLLELSVNILTTGNKKEIKNFYCQWFTRILQKDELFEMLQEKPEIALFIDNSADYLMDNEHSYRLILIFSMFSKQIFQLSKLHFFKLSTELLTNCFQYDTECQLLIFKFVVDNLASFAIEDCMEFVQVFLRTHSSVDNAQSRNTVLGKMPNIINYIAKTYCKLCLDNDQTSSLGSSILNFFIHMQKHIDEGIASDIYQPKIFCLKLLEILIKSLYSAEIKKNSKNCILSQNQQLGLFLKHHKVYEEHTQAMRLIQLVNDPLGFDDALDLIVYLMKMIKPPEIVLNLALDLCQRTCTLPDVDECNLSFLYARIAVQNCNDKEKIKEFRDIIVSNLKEKLPHYDKDPLLACKTQDGHLFGLLNVLCELNEYRPELCSDEYINVIALVEEILNMIIRKLNLAVLENENDIVTAASFEDMDKSLELLVCQSEFKEEENHVLARKYLLMSFWLSLKACCDLAASMGCYHVKGTTACQDSRDFLHRCLQVSATVLTKCRHKGAIESAGISIGKLTKCITTLLSPDSAEFNLLHLCLEQLYKENESSVSNTRRGAGFSIMFLHILKNEEQRSRPILKRAVENLLKTPQETGSSLNKINCDRLEALYLHFLCVLVRDCELREAMSIYYNEIIMAAVKQIDHNDWTICNGALQLFGALVPKIVGQKQANEFEEPLPWEPCEVTFSEINRKLPKACDYIIKYCLNEKSSTRSIILFLEFLHKVEYIFKGELDSKNPVFNYRQLMWSLLQHNSEKVRKLAAKCFIRAHEFRFELPHILQQMALILFSIKNENFFEGLVYCLHEGILKLKHESHFIIPLDIYQEIEKSIKQNLHTTFQPQQNEYKFFTLCKLWDLLKLIDHTDLLEQLKDLVLPVDEKNVSKMLGYDLWLERINTF